MKTQKFHIYKKRIMQNTIISFGILLALMLIQVLALIVVSSLQGISSINSLVNREMGYCVANFENTFDNIHQMLVMLKLDTNVVESMVKPQLNPLSQNQLMITLKKYKELNQEIKNIYIYNSSQNIIYSSVKPIEKLELFPFDRTRDILNKTSDHQRICFIRDQADEAGIYGSEPVFRMILTYDNKSKDAIIVDVSYETVKNMFAGFKDRLDGDIFIASDNGEIIYYDGELDSDEMSSLLITNKNNISSDIHSYQKNRSFIAMKHITQLSVDVYGVVSTNSIQMDSFHMRSFLLINLVIILIVLLAVILALIMRHQAKIMRNNIKKAKQMENVDVRENFILQNKVITDFMEYPAEEYVDDVKSKLNTLWPDINNYDISLMRVDIFEPAGKHMSIKEKFSFIAEIEKRLNQYMHSKAIFEQDEYALFMIVSPQVDYITNCHDIYNILVDELSSSDIHLNAYISDVADLSNIKGLYEEIFRIKKYVFIYGHSVFLDYNVLMISSQEPDGWISNSISDIKNEILTLSENAYVLIDEFINGLKTLNIDDAIRGVYELYYTLISCVDQMTREHMGVSFDIMKFTPDFSKTRTIDEWKDFFHKSITSINSQIGKQHKEVGNSKYEIIVKRSINIMQEHLCDYNLSRSMIADEVGISKSYLSRIYKTVTGVSLSDAITDMRLKYVEQQLVSTNRNIKDIISDVGVANQSYFTVLFKKKYGISPNEYRNKKRKDL